MNLPQRKAIKAIEDEFGEEDSTLAEFTKKFIEEHAVKGPEGGVIVLDVSREEYEWVGRDIVQILVGWAAGLKGSRKRRGILPVTNPDDYLQELDEDKEVDVHIH